MASFALGEELNCSICLSLYKEPVTLRCGHNFCKGCIVTALDTQEVSRVYFCPDCRQQYPQRPLLEKNRKLCNIVEHFQSAQAQEETKIFCTYCVDSSVVAIKTCLQCEASFCAIHLRQHLKSTDHDLVEPIASLAGRKCPMHNEMLKYYCSVEGICICMSCWVTGGHVGHKAELLTEAAEKKKEKMSHLIESLNSAIQESKRRIQILHNRHTEERRKAATLMETVSKLFRESRAQLENIRSSMDDAENIILAELAKQEETTSQKVSVPFRQLEMQKDDLIRKLNQIKELRDIADPLTLLKKEINTDLIKQTTIHDSSQGKWLTKETISAMLRQKVLHITNSMTDLSIKMRYMESEKADILLDIDTAHHHIILSQDLRMATYTEVKQERPDVPERFKTCQVISRQSFSSGIHYWEVDVSGAKEWLIGVAAHNVRRKASGRESFIGYNDKSWALAARDFLLAGHNNKWTSLDSGSPLISVRICLDYEGGHLSFYQLRDTARHLHTFTATFTEPLHAAFYVFKSCCLRVM